MVSSQRAPDGELPPTGSASADSWRGHPRTVTRRQAATLAQRLDALWQAQAAAAGADGDHQTLRAWFDPVARGGRLRAALDALPAADALVEAAPKLSPTFLIDAGEGRLLVTPEGRELHLILEQALDSNPGDSETVRLSWEATDAADGRLFSVYRDMAMSRLTSVMKLRQGGAAPLLPQGIGLVLLLLLNGNVGPGRSLARPERDADRRAVDEAVAAVTGAFADALSPSRSVRGRSPSAYSLHGGYAISEARRRLASDLAKDPVFLARGSEDRTVRRLAEELRRRPGVDADRVGLAMDELAAAYRRWRPTLASYGLAQGRPSVADALRDRLVEAYRQAT
jgi:hypothetical protein